MSQNFRIVTSENGAMHERLFDELGDAILILRKSNETNDLITDVHFLDPFTWEWLIVKFAEGIASYVAGKTFQEVFFPSISNAKVIEALSHKIEEAVSILQKYIDEKFEMHDAQIAQRQVYTIYTLLREYTNAPHGDIGRLSTVNHDATELWNFVYLRGEAAFIPGCLAASLKVAALWTRYRETKDNGDRQNVKEFIEIAIQSISNWKAEIYKRNHVFELTEITTNCSSEDVNVPHEGGPGKYNLSEWTCWSDFRANGNNFSFSSDPGKPHRDEAYGNSVSKAAQRRNIWLNQRDVVEPFVIKNLIYPADYIIARLKDAQAAIK
jgi:hypothetical protein